MPDSGAFENFLAQNPGATTFWIGGHTHTNPDDRHGGRGLIETKWNVHFINTAALTKYHAPFSVPMSRLWTFEEGSRKVRVQCYLHTSDFASQGWYAPAERILELPRPFSMR